MLVLHYRDIFFGPLAESVAAVNELSSDIDLAALVEMFLLFFHWRNKAKAVHL